MKLTVSRKLFMGFAIKKEQLNARGYLIVKDESSAQKFNTAHESFLTLSRELGDIIKLPEAKKLLAELIELEKQFREIAVREMQLKDQDKTDEYLKLLTTQGHEVAASFDSKMDELTAYQQNVMDEGHKSTSVPEQQKISDNSFQRNSPRFFYPLKPES